MPVRLTQKRLQHAMLLKPILESRYPHCFFKDGQPRKPLKIGIDKDLLPLCDELDFVTRKSIKRFLALYCSDPLYLKALLAEDAIRIDLEGNPTEAVTVQEKEKSKENPRRVYFEERRITHTPKKTKPKQSSATKPPSKKQLSGKVKTQPLKSNSHEIKKPKSAAKTPVVTVKRQVIRGPDGKPITRRRRVYEVSRDEA